MPDVNVLSETGPEKVPHDRAKCTGCGVFHSNGSQHICVKYSADHPCEQCGSPTVFVHIASPGAGMGRSCSEGHYRGTVRELTIDEVR